MRELVGQAHDYALLAEDRSQFPEYPSEHEIVGTLLFRSCGCSVGRSSSLASSGGAWMCALFRSLPRLPESCQFVIEAKRFGAGVKGLSIRLGPTLKSWVSYATSS